MRVLKNLFSNDNIYTLTNDDKMKAPRHVRKFVSHLSCFRNMCTYLWDKNQVLGMNLINRYFYHHVIPAIPQIIYTNASLNILFDIRLAKGV